MVFYAKSYREYTHYLSCLPTETSNPLPIEFSGLKEVYSSWLPQTDSLWRADLDEGSLSSINELGTG